MTEQERRMEQAMTAAHRKMLECIAEMERQIGYDSYHLTRDDQDAIFYRLHAIEELVNELYRQRILDGRTGDKRSEDH